MIKLTLVVLLLIVPTLQQFPPEFPPDFPPGGFPEPIPPQDPTIPQNPPIPPINQGPSTAPNNGEQQIDNSQSSPPPLPGAEKAAFVAPTPPSPPKQPEPDYTVEKNVSPPQQIAGRLNQAAARNSIQNGDRTASFQKSSTSDAYGTDTTVDLEQAAASSAPATNGRGLYHWCGWWRITLNVLIDCPEKGFWIRVRGPGYLWAQVNGYFLNFWPYRPWPWSRWIYVPPGRTRCGCNKVVLWYWTCYHWLSWFVYKPPQTCIRDCVRDYRQFWDYRSCKCKCKNRCCRYPWQSVPLYPAQFYGCRCR